MAISERPNTLDPFGSRLRVIPGEVRGPLKRWRSRVYFVLLLVFLALPWIRIGGRQALLLDIPARRFEMFGGLFLAHDAPLLFLIMMLAMLLIVLVTALWGRVWCGWACPQTVFIEAVYRRIEIWIEGNYIERRRLHARPMDVDKFRKVATKWLLFLVVSSVFAHSFIAYFVDSRRLLEMMQASPGENWVYFLMVSCVTALLAFNFGWFREQFCLVMCPYGRFQSVLMDSQSVTVAYDEKRDLDCVKCNRCVQVCPTGINIRHGLQMECIGCTACIDACNEIMTKVKKPQGLIRYKRAAEKALSVWRPRISAYLAMIVVLVGILIASLSGRQGHSITVLRAKDVPFQILSDGRVMNHFKAHFVNQERNSQKFEILLPQDLQERGVALVQGGTAWGVPAGGSLNAPFFLTFPTEILEGRGEAKLRVQVREAGGTESEIPLTVVGP